MYPTPNEFSSYSPAWPCAHFRFGRRSERLSRRLVLSMLPQSVAMIVSQHASALAAPQSGQLKFANFRTQCFPHRQIWLTMFFPLPPNSQLWIIHINTSQTIHQLFKAKTIYH